jgi:DNA-binding response OmpR family regulator
MNRILLVEDDESLNRGITYMLEKEGYQVSACYSLSEVRKSQKEDIVSLIICDINLPDGSGLESIKEIRKKSNVHIICLTALDEEVNQIIGYEAGADDYITKPFSLAVLLLKINAYFKKQSLEEQQIIESGKISFSLREMKIWKEEREILLTKNEWKMLQAFLNNPKQILSKRQLQEQVFDIDGKFVDDNTIAVNIRRLREKIEVDAASPKYIKNIRGLGYIWDKECVRR